MSEQICKKIPRHGGGGATALPGQPAKFAHYNVPVGQKGEKIKKKVGRPANAVPTIPSDMLKTIKPNKTGSYGSFPFGKKGSKLVSKHQSGSTINTNLWNTNKKAYVDSVLQTNNNLDFVKRLYNSKQSIPTPNNIGGWEPGQRSTHLMSDDPGSKRVYPEVVNKNGVLQYMPGDKAWDYADSTKEFIQFPTAAKAEWFANSKDTLSGYKMGTNVLSNISPQTGLPFVPKNRMEYKK